MKYLRDIKSTAVICPYLNRSRGANLSLPFHFFEWRQIGVLLWSDEAGSTLLVQAIGFISTVLI